MRISRRAASSKAIPIFAAVLALAVVAWVARPTGDSDSVVAVGMIDTWRPEVGKVAPDFALVDLRDAEKLVQLSDFRGKTVVLNWYATWCGPCRAELPDFEEVYQQLDGEVVILALNLQESPEAAAKMLDEVGATFPGASDAEGDIASHYGIRGMPTTFFIDAEGIIRMSGSGRITRETLHSELALLGHQLDSSTP